MAAAVYPVKVPQSQQAAELLQLLATINDTYARLLTVRAAMIQEKDGSAGNATDYVTISKRFQFLNADGVTIDSTVAMNAFLELDTFVTNGGPSLQQCCARFKQ